MQIQAVNFINFSLKPVALKKVISNTPRLNFCAAAKPIIPNEVEKARLINERKKLLTKITSKDEYNEILKEISKYECRYLDKTLPYLYLKGYESIDDKLKALVIYCGMKDRSRQINCWLSGRKNDYVLSDDKMSKIIRALDYSLSLLDKEFGTYEGVVYRSGYFNPLVFKQYYSSSSSPMGAMMFSDRLSPSSEDEYSIIKLKKGHDITSFQKSVKSGIARLFAKREKEILIDRNSKFRLIPEEEYSTNDIKMKNKFIAQIIKEKAKVSSKTIDKIAKTHPDAKNHVSIWEEI